MKRGIKPLLLLAAAAALGGTAAAQDQQPPGAADFDLAKEKVIDCAGQKFVFAWGAGAHPTKVTLCSKKGASAEQVIQLIDEAADKIEAATAIPEERRSALVQQMRAKIAELQATLPSAPAAKAPAPAPAPTPATPAPAETAPAMPAPAVALPAAPPATRPVPVAAKLRLTFQCYTPGDIGSGGPCISLGRETRLTVKAADALPAGTSLQFVRNGEIKAAIALDPMRQGQSARLLIPRQLCAGVVEAEAQIRVARGNQVVDTLGPYLLRC